MPFDGLEVVIHFEAASTNLFLNGLHNHKEYTKLTTTLFISVPSFIQEELLSLPFIIIGMDMDMKKNKKDREIIRKDNNALIKNPSDSSVLPRAFAEEANMEERTLQADAARSAATDMAIKERSKKQENNNMKQAIPMSLKSELFNESILADQLVDTKHPGATEIFPGGVSPLQPLNRTHAHGISQDQLPETTMGVSDVEVPHSHEPTLNAILVNDATGVVASATLIDEDAEEKKNLQHRMRTILGSFITASIIATAVAVPVLLTHSGSAQTFVGSPTSSPIPSAVPSFTPTSSPSTALFGFLAANSFDDGSALDIPGSPQQMALDWLVNVSGIFEMDYHLLQNYALVTFYFETAGKQWTSTGVFDTKRSVLQSASALDDEEFTGEWLNVTPSVNPLGFCNWLGVMCNDNQEIDSLMLSSNQLKGSIPAELGILYKSLSKSYIIWIPWKAFAANDMHF